MPRTTRVRATFTLHVDYLAGGGMPRTEITAKKLSIQCVRTVEREKPHQIRDSVAAYPSQSQYSHMNTWTHFKAV